MNFKISGRDRSCGVAIELSGHVHARSAVRRDGERSRRRWKGEPPKAHTAAHIQVSTTDASIPQLSPEPRQPLRRGYFEYLRSKPQDQ